MRDRVFQDKKEHIVDFAFDDEVVAVFPDMIRRSVPGYEVVIPITGLLAARHLGDSGTAFDLGCSLGASTLAILKQTDAPVRVVGVDSSEPMIEQARTLITDARATFVCDDMRAVDVSAARVIVMNFVMQFMNSRYAGHFFVKPQVIHFIKTDRNGKTKRRGFLFQVMSVLLRECF